MSEIIISKEALIKSEYLLEKWFRHDTMKEFKNKCQEILKTRALYLEDVYNIYEELFGTKLDTDLAIEYHKEITKYHKL